MTKENLLKYLRDPKYLEQISYQELKTLVAEHPNSLSLRYLLALKSKQENNSDFERQLAYLATYGFDRAHLFDVFNKQEVSSEIDDIEILQEDYLELKELSALERELTAKPLSKANDLIFEMEPPISINPTYIEPKKERPNLEQEDYYVLNFDEELNPTLAEEEGPDMLESRVEGNLAAIEDLFKDLEEESSSNEQIVPLNNSAVAELELQETVEGGDFPDIPLEVLDTNVDVVGEETSQAATMVASKQQSGMISEGIQEEQIVPTIGPDVIQGALVIKHITTKSDVDEEVGQNANVEINNQQKEEQTKDKKGSQPDSIIIPDSTEETLVVNPIPKSSFSTWYEHGGAKQSFSGFDLVGFNSKGIIKELSASEKELQIAEQIREEKLRLAKLQATKRAAIVRATKTIVTRPTQSAKEEVKSSVVPPIVNKPEKKDKNKKKKKKKKGILKQIKNEAETSFIFEDDIASETLAQLLVLQGHYSKARAMYEHLSLIFPEKSGLFAYEIQKIENLDDEVA